MSIVCLILQSTKIKITLLHFCFFFFFYGLIESSIYILTLLTRVVGTTHAIFTRCRLNENNIFFYDETVCHYYKLHERIIWLTPIQTYVFL